MDDRAHTQEVQYHDFKIPKEAGIVMDLIFEPFYHKNKILHKNSYIWTQTKLVGNYS